MTHSVKQWVRTLQSTASPVPSSSERRKHGYKLFVHWVRKTHGWIGLWGALLGLIFGLSGIWLNHRAVMKLPLSQQRHQAQLMLPEPVPASPDEMAHWLEMDLELPGPPNQVRVEPAKRLPWVEKGQPNSDNAKQPERWQFNYGGPDETTQIEFWKGNHSVSITTTQHGVMATLTNLHKGSGMTLPWILLVDTLAGSMIFLSISGVILWVQFNRRRALGACIFGASLMVTLGLVLARL